MTTRGGVGGILNTHFIARRVAVDNFRLLSPFLYNPWFVPSFYFVTVQLRYRANLVLTRTVMIFACPFEKWTQPRNILMMMTEQENDDGQWLLPFHPLLRSSEVVIYPRGKKGSEKWRRTRREEGWKAHMIMITEGENRGERKRSHTSAKRFLSLYFFFKRGAHIYMHAVTWLKRGLAATKRHTTV